MTPHVQCHTQPPLCRESSCTSFAAQIHAHCSRCTAGRRAQARIADPAATCAGPAGQNHSLKPASRIQRAGSGRRRQLHIPWAPDRNAALQGQSSFKRTAIVWITRSLVPAASRPTPWVAEQSATEHYQGYLLRIWPEAGIAEARIY
jgi:hypothetical protein